MKICKNCGIEKPESEFNKDISKKDGFTYTCKICIKNYSLNYYKNNKNKIIEQNKLYFQLNKSKILEKTKKYYYKNKEKVNKNSKIYYELNKNNNKEKYKTRYKNYYNKNKQVLNNNRKIHRENNLEKDNITKRNYFLNNKKEIYRKRKEKLNDNPIYKIRLRLSARIYNSLKRNSKSAHTMELLGCTIEQLKKHLEKQFTLEMNWNNYGTYWHVDHIMPCSSFNLSIPDHQKYCFNYKNLRPLEAKENLKKGEKLVLVS